MLRDQDYRVPRVMMTEHRVTAEWLLAEETEEVRDFVHHEFHVKSLDPGLRKEIPANIFYCLS